MMFQCWASRRRWANIKTSLVSCLLGRSFSGCAHPVSRTRQSSIVLVSETLAQRCACFSRIMYRPQTTSFLVHGTDGLRGGGGVHVLIWPAPHGFKRTRRQYIHIRPSWPTASPIPLKTLSIGPMPDQCWMDLNA